jgi:hypothetical protein
LGLKLMRCTILQQKHVAVSMQFHHNCRVVVMGLYSEPISQRKAWSGKDSFLRSVVGLILVVKKRNTD